jgi:hypothetical protein
MPRALARTLCAVAAAIATPVVYYLLLAWLVVEYGVWWVQAFFIADILTAAIISIGWIGIWRSHVCWTRARIIWTGTAWCLALAAGIGAHILTWFLWIGVEAGCVLAGLSWWAAWIFGTAIVWRENRHERMQRTTGSIAPMIRCAGCGYNMSGLYEARCPECGAQYTLDQIVASATDADAARDG